MNDPILIPPNFQQDINNNPRYPFQQQQNNNNHINYNPYPYQRDVNQQQKQTYPYQRDVIQQQQKQTYPYQQDVIQQQQKPQSYHQHMLYDNQFNNNNNLLQQQSQLPRGIQQQQQQQQQQPQQLQQQQQLQPQHQQQQIAPINNNNNYNDKNMIQQAYQLLINNASNADELKRVKENLEKTIESLSEDCVMSHLITQLSPNNIHFYSSDKVYSIFKNHFAKNIQDRHERVFESFCMPCTLVKLGLISDYIQKPMGNKACTMNPSKSGDTYFNFGKFIHGYAANKIDTNKHPDIGKYSETIAFPPGVIIIPDSKIITQITDMDINNITMGVKVCMINSEEKNVTNGAIMTRFLARNRTLDCGYYVRDKSINMKDYNSSNKGKKTKLNELPDISVMNTELKLFLDKYNRKKYAVDLDDSNTRPFGTSKYHDDKTDVNDLYIPSVDDDASFNADNIFQNGEPLKQVLPEDTYQPDDIGMRVFDINPALISYLVNMLNLQSEVEREHINKLKNKYNNDNKSLNILDPETHFLSNNRLVNHSYYDFLCLAFFNELNQEKLCQLPPFNGECILSHSNILFVNKHGDSIMINKNPDLGKCTMYNRLIKLMEGSNIKHKFISTASNTNLTQSGRVPRAVFTVEAVKELFQGMIKGDNEKDKLLEQDKKVYNDFVTQSANIFKDEHNKIKNSSDILQHYFCKFQNDINEPVKFEGNEMAFDMARKIYPQFILDNRKNRMQITLDYSVKNSDEAIIDEQHQPNLVYIENLGFTTLTYICNNSPLILKNASVLLPNLRNRFTKNKNAIISNISGCKRKAGSDFDDDLDDYILPKAQIIADLPEKKKLIPGIIDLTGEESDLDYLGHIRRKECIGPGIRDYMNKFANINDSSYCLKGL